MPELPEVEHARSLLERFVVGQRIVKVRVGPDTIVCAEDCPQKIAKTFRGAIMEVPDRRGKQLWLPLVDRPAVLVHLGMTGAVRVRGEQGLHLVAHGSVAASSGASSESAPQLHCCQSTPTTESHSM